MEKKRILVLVKAEPSPSKKYGSTVCTAGVTEEGEFIRLYPIAFSMFCDKDRKFTKYDWIECECEKADPSDDSRRESYKVREDSIHVVGHMDTDLVWEERNEVIRPLISKNFEELEARGASLGIIRPEKVLKLVNEPVRGQEHIDKEYKDCFQVVFDEEGGMLKIPKIKALDTYYRYHFTCENDATVHEIMCEDWELYQASRSWKHVYGTDEDVWNRVHDKFYREFCEEKDLCFIVGTHYRFKTWMIIGLYYPPKGSLNRKLWF